MEQIIQNGIMVRETGEVLLSTHRHDYRTMEVKNIASLEEPPETIHVSVDGGHAYIRRGWGHSKREKGLMEKEGAEEFYKTYDPSTSDISKLISDISLSNESPVDEVVCKLCWGTRGKDGTEPLKHLFIMDCTSDHLDALMEYSKSKPISPIHLAVMKHWHNLDNNGDESLTEIARLVKEYISPE